MEIWALTFPRVIDFTLADECRIKTVQDCKKSFIMYATILRIFKLNAVCSGIQGRG